MQVVARTRVLVVKGKGQEVSEPDMIQGGLVVKNRILRKLWVLGAVLGTVLFCVTAAENSSRKPNDKF